MENEWLNGTWFNDSQTTVPNVNRTTDDILPNKNPQTSGMNWATRKDAMYVVEIVLHCTFLIVGLCGNILILAVLLYKKWTNITSRYVLMALAVSDTMMLITQTFDQDFIKDLFKLDARAFSNIACKIFFVLYRTSKMTSSWFVVFICLERFIAVTFPLKVKQIITEQRTKIYILVNYLTMTVFNIFLSFSTGVENRNCKQDVFASNEKSTFRALMLTEILLYSVIPTLLMSTFTPFIILKLVKQYQAKKRLSNNTDKGNEREKYQIQDLIRTTTTLISVVIVFIICVTPVTVFQQVKFWQKMKKKENYYIYMLKEISQRFEQINYSINFFLYILTSPTFRKCVFEMLHIKRERKAPNAGSRSKSNAQTNATALSSAKKSASMDTAGSDVEPGHTEIPICSKEQADIGVTATEAKADVHMISTCIKKQALTKEPTNIDIQTKKVPIYEHEVPTDTEKADGNVLTSSLHNFLKSTCNEVSTETEGHVNTETADDQLDQPCTEETRVNKEPTGIEKPAKADTFDHLVHLEPSDTNKADSNELKSSLDNFLESTSSELSTKTEEASEFK